jgi:hypothetical protein
MCRDRSGGHQNQQSKEHETLKLTPAGPHASDSQLLIDYLYSGLLVGTLQLSLGVHFSKTTCWTASQA